MYPKRLFSAFLCAVLFAGVAAYSVADDNFPYEDPSWINNAPPTSYWGLRGLPYTLAAEPLGVGRFNVAFRWAFSRQEQDIVKPDSVGAWMHGIRGAFSWGLGERTDFFGILPLYVVTGVGDKETQWHFASQLTGGMQYSLPIPPELPLRIALHANLVYALGRPDVNDQFTINENYLGEKDEVFSSYAGYDYFEAGTLDHFVVKVPISLIAGNNRRGIKFHLNPGVAFTPKDDGRPLALASAGLQIDPIEFMTFGFEGNWRSPFGSLSLADPLWITPSLGLRSAYYGGDGLLALALIMGADIRMSAKDGNKTYPLEKWRGFADLVASFDRHASRRAEEARRARAAEAERARLAREAQLSAAQRDSIAIQARADSLRLATEMHERARADSIRAAFLADSMAAAMAAMDERSAQREAELIAQRMADSLANAQALAEAQKKLDEERARRSEQEQMLLTTGMLTLEAMYFQPGRSDIHINLRPYLTTIARMLVKYPKLRVEIGGHTDNTGRFETNMRLSQQRAEAVFMFMVSVEPQLSQMLTARGYGSTSPKADNATAAGREMNRRVELKVLNPEVLKEYNP